MINQYLMRISPETGQQIYALLGDLQWPAFAGIFIWATIRYKVSLKNTIALWTSFIIARFWGCNMVPVLSQLTDGVIPSANMGVAFAPVMLIIAAIVYFVNTPVLLSLDIAVPAFILGRGLAITGCIFTGCCHGFPVSWGIYSYNAQTNTFPTVLLDIVASCSIVAYLIVLSKKQKFSGKGIVTAIGMILFGFLRSLIDILRDNRKLIGPITIEGILGIVYIIAGCLIMKYIYEKRPKNVS